MAKFNSCFVHGELNYFLFFSISYFNSLIILYSLFTWHSL